MLPLRLPGRFFAAGSTPHAVKKRQRTVVAGFAAASRAAVRSCDREDGWRQGGAVRMAIRGRVMRSPAAVSLALVRLREDASLPASEAPASGKSLRV